jgi:hypothetical protein
MTCFEHHDSQKHDLSAQVNSLNAELNPICYFLALLEAHHILHVGRIRVKFVNLVALFSLCLLSLF